MRGAAATAGLLVLALTAGCAYYNTLYFARKYYRDAEQLRTRAPEGDLPSSAGELYLKSATKCAKVITEHPKSRWVDDAILLMGDCFYRRGEYERALKKYEELATLYPQSNLLPRANLMSGMALWSLGRYTEAVESFARVKEAEREDERRAEAWLMLGRCRLDGGDAEQAVAELDSLLAWPKVGGRRDEARYWLGESLARVGRMDEALEALRAAAAAAREEKLREKLELRTSEVMVEKGEYAAAAAYLGELAEREVDPVRERQLRLRLADAQLHAGERDEALATLKEIVKEAPKGEDGAEAEFRIGFIYQRELLDYDAALAVYDSVREISAMAPATRRAAEERKKIMDARGYEETLAGLDSTRAAEAARVHFLLAETYYQDLENLEAALPHYVAAQEADPAGELGPRALLAAAWLLARPLSRGPEAADLLRKLIAAYPETQQAERARALLEEMGEELPLEIPLPPRESGLTFEPDVVPLEIAPLPADSLRADSVAAKEPRQEIE